MIRETKIKTTIKEYKNRKENEGKTAIFQLDDSTVIFEGDETDWVEMQIWVDEHNGWTEKKNLSTEKFYLITVPRKIKAIQGFLWR